MTIVLVGFILGTLTLGAIVTPVSGVMGYFAVYILYNPEIWWGAALAQRIARPSFISMCFLAVGCLLHFGRLDFRMTRREVYFYLFLLTAWGVTFLFGAGVHEITWQYLEKLSKTFVFIFFLVRIITDIRSYNLVIWTLLLGGVFLAYQSHVIGGFSDGRLDNIGGIDFREANSFASFLMFCITIMGFKMLGARWWRQLLYVAAIGLMLNAVVMTQSRAVFLGIALALPYVLVRTPRGHRRRVFFFAGLAVVLFFIVTDTKFWERMGTIGDEAGRIENGGMTASDEELSRIDFWKASLRIFADNPMGIGVKNFEEVVPLYDARIPGMDAHNTYVLVYSEIGAVGILLFVVIIVSAWRQLDRIRKLRFTSPDGDRVVLHAVALQTVIIIYALGTMMTHSNLYSEFIWILLALPLCLENAVLKLVDSEDASTPTPNGSPTEPTSQDRSLRPSLEQ